MTQKEILLEQLAACHNQTNWFVTQQTALKGLTPEQASRQSMNVKENHSIWQLVNHIIFWNERYLNRLKGITQPKIEGGNDSTFGAEKSDGTESEWQAAVSRLDTILSDLYNEVNNADETKLQNSAFGTDDSWYAIIANVTIHNAYHIGQIVTLRKEQGSWNSETGVK